MKHDCKLTTNSALRMLLRQLCVNSWVSTSNFVGWRIIPNLQSFNSAHKKASYRWDASGRLDGSVDVQRNHLSQQWWEKEVKSGKQRLVTRVSPDFAQAFLSASTRGDLEFPESQPRAFGESILHMGPLTRNAARVVKPTWIYRVRMSTDS